MYPANTFRDILGALVIQENGCALWTRGTHKGYGYVNFQGRKVKVHRLMYERFVGPVPKGWHVHHECENRRCANFAHLKAMPAGKHVLLSDNCMGRNSRKTHCPRGHPYEGDNVIVRNASRFCKACRPFYQQRYRARKKAVIR